MKKKNWIVIYGKTFMNVGSVPLAKEVAKSCFDSIDDAKYLVKIKKVKKNENAVGKSID